MLAHSLTGLLVRMVYIVKLVVLMTAKVVYLDEDDRKLILETRQKLEETTKLMDELLETVEILSDPDMMEAIREGLEDIRAGRVTELRKLLKEEAR